MDIFFDIETIPGSDAKPSGDDIKVPGNYKDPAKIAAYQHAHAEEAWRKQSLVSPKGRVWVIGFAVEDASPLSTTVQNEAEAMVEFWDIITSAHGPRLRRESIRWIGFNIKSFDMNWLYHRAVKYGMHELMGAIPRGRYSDFIIDIRDEWNGGDWKAEGTLDDIARFLGVGRKTPGIDGSKVFDYWRKGRFDEVAAYCRDDVTLTRDVYRKMHPAV